MRDKRGETRVAPRARESKVRNGKVSFQAAINRRGASHLTTSADNRMRERRGRYSSLVPSSRIGHQHAARGRTYFGESSRRIPIFRFDIPIKRGRFVYELVRDACVRVRAQPRRPRRHHVEVVTSKRMNGIGD